MSILDYHIADEAEMRALGYDFPDELFGKVLIGPNEFECHLGEPEDCSWYRDGSLVVSELNKLNQQIKELKENSNAS